MEQPDLLGGPTLTQHSWASVSGQWQEYRWQLGRRWDNRRPCLFIGHNPSTADGATDDPTTRRWAHFARAWGHGGYIAVNLYPIRCSDVDACYDWRDGKGAATEIDVGIAMDRNLQEIMQREAECSRIVACWGALAREPNWVDKVVSMIRAVRGTIYCFGVTKSGAPKHPMARGIHRVPDDFEPIMFAP